MDPAEELQLDRRRCGPYDAQVVPGYALHNLGIKIACVPIQIVSTEGFTPGHCAQNCARDVSKLLRSQ